MVRCFLTYMMLLIVCWPVYAADLAIDLAENRVDITTGFTGDDLILFGTKAPGSDVVITVKGPPKNMIVRRKERILGVWINRKSVAFENVPGYYSYAASDFNFLEEENAALKGIKLDQLSYVAKGKVKAKDKAVFQKALIRNKQAQKLFPTAPQEIAFLTDEFFRTRFNLPPNVPMGTYEITTYLLQDNKLVNKERMTVDVKQIGTSATINHFAYKQSLLYGVLCIVFAVIVGWLSYIVRQRIR
jgi:uncharacterized protein (TIGR02186 family)